MNDSEWKWPALIGGLIVALPSFIPYVGYGDFVLCLWSWVGGIVAAKMLTTRSSRIQSLGDGARIGLLAGLIGGVIYLIVAAPIIAWQMPRVIEQISATPNFPSEWTETFLLVQENFAIRVGVALLAGLLAGAFRAGFTVLGGMLGVAIFEKRKQNVPPTYPPQYPPQDPSGGGWPNP